MPNLEAKRIPVWLTQCEVLTLTGPYLLTTGKDENCLVQLRTAKCSAVRDQQVQPLPANTVILLGRSTSVLLQCADTQPYECLVLRYRHTFSQPSLDLNLLCLTISSVDSFLGQKTRFCVLSDHEYIYMTLSALCYEWSHQEPDRDAMILSLMHELFIKLSRSFHAHNQPTGIRYLNIARAYIQKRYQYALTLDEIAEHAGISRSYLTQLFSQHMNRTVVNYIQAIRCDRAGYLLSSTRFPIIDIAIETGFNSRQHFARTFEKVYGLSPSAFRQLHRTHDAYSRLAAQEEEDAENELE